MKKIHLLAVLAALVFSAFGSTAVAQAGCLAVAGYPTYNSNGSIQSTAGIECTTNNGSSYTVRGYIQGDSGGWHSVNINAPYTYNVPSPVNGYQSHRLWFMQCSFFTPADDNFRSKVTVHNNVANTTDTSISSINGLLPLNCY